MTYLKSPKVESPAENWSLAKALLMLKKIKKRNLRFKILDRRLRITEILKLNLMKIIRHLNQNSRPALALTIGNFDGVHLGHRKIITEVKKIAKEKNLTSAILTFEPHPVSFLRPNQTKDFRITTLSQKLKIFQQQEINRVILLSFNQKMASLKAEDFIKEILVKSLNIKHLSIGYDFIFGKNREGNFKLLLEASKQFNFELEQISALEKSNQICSSSIIRKFISEGKITEANKFLDSNFIISGIVNEGRKLANQLGFPTANLATNPQMIKPKFGVYKTNVFIPSLNKKFSAITNFGVKPTIEKSILPLFETHILGFNQNIYGKKIEVELLDFIREEKKFESLDELKRQIKIDLNTFFEKADLHIL